MALLTAKALQPLLQIDRSTIYRMAEDGRLPGFKVGKQWRFTEEAINQWLKENGSPASINNNTLSNKIWLPVNTVEPVLDSFAYILEVMLIVTDLEGHPLTKPSNPCGLFSLIEQNPNLITQCIQSWHSLGNNISLQPQLLQTHLGLLCTRGLIHLNGELKGMVIAGCIPPEQWPPSAEEIDKIAAEFNLSSDTLSLHIDHVFPYAARAREKITHSIQPVADAIAHIAAMHRNNQAAPTIAQTAKKD